MSRPSIVGASMVVLAVAAAFGCAGNPPATEPAMITPEQARAALLKLKGLQSAGGGVIDPHAELRTGAIVSTGDSSATIGRLFFFDLRKKTWRMDFSNGRTGKAAFACEASGRFEWHDGTWVAIQTEGGISYYPGEEGRRAGRAILAADGSGRTSFVACSRS